MVSKARLFRAQAAHAVFQFRRQILLFMPGATRATACSKAASWSPRERRMSSISAADFTMRSSSIQPVTGSSEAFSGRRDLRDSN